jgi:hypothetical protein
MCKKNKEIKKESKGPGTHARLPGPDLIFFYFQGGEPPLILFLEKKK